MRSSSYVANGFSSFFLATILNISSSVESFTTSFLRSGVVSGANFSTRFKFFSVIKKGVGYENFFFERVVDSAYNLKSFFSANLMFASTFGVISVLELPSYLIVNKGRLFFVFFLSLELSYCCSSRSFFY